MLDVGCNTGLIGRTLGVLGNKIDAIDNAAVDYQGSYERLSGVVKADLFDYLETNKEETDGGADI